MTSEAKDKNGRRLARYRVVLACVLTLALVSLMCLPEAALAESPEASSTDTSGIEQAAEGSVSTLSKKDMGCVSKEEEGSVYESGEVCVLFDEDASPGEAEAELDEIGLSLGDELGTSLEKGKAYAPSIEDGDSVAETLDEIRGNPSDVIAYAQPNYIYKSDDSTKSEMASVEGTVPSSSATTYDDEDSLQESWQLDAVNAQKAWGITKTEGTVTVAVIDSGVDGDHEDLKDRIVAGYDSVEDNDDYDDGNGHGTHVAGIIAATADNSLGIQGVSYNANLIAIDAAYSDDDSGWYKTTDLANAYKWLIASNFVHSCNLRVINMSLGGTNGMDDLLSGYINDAYNAGILTICSAGNNNTDALHFPSDHEKCMGVIALDQYNNRASYSNYGYSKDIAAPGGTSSYGIYSTTYDGKYGYKYGTSMASPVVAGVAALVFATDPQLGAEDVREILTSTAIDLGEPGFDEDTAYGCVDAHAAVKEALCHRRGHSFTDRSLASKQSCTEDGVYTYTCSICGESYEKRIAPPGHLWSNCDYTTIYENPVLPLTYEAEYYSTSKVSHKLEYLYLYDEETLVMSVNTAEDRIYYINPKYANYSLYGVMTEIEDYSYLHSVTKTGNNISVTGVQFTLDADETHLYDSYALVYNGSSTGSIFTATNAATPYDTYVMHFADRLPVTASVVTEYTGADNRSGNVDYVFLYDDKTLVMSVNVSEGRIYYMNSEYALTGVSGGISTGEATSETVCLNCGESHDG